MQNLFPLVELVVVFTIIAATVIASLKALIDWVGRRPAKIGLCIAVFCASTGALVVLLGNLNVAIILAFSLLLTIRLISSLTGWGEQKARSNTEKLAYFVFAFWSIFISLMALIFKDFNPG